MDSLSVFIIGVGARRCCAALALGLTVWIAEKAQAAEEFEVAGWKGYVKQGLQEAHPGCLMVQTVGNNTFFVVHLDTDLEFSLGLYSPDAALLLGSTATGRVIVDQSPPVAVSGRATSSDTIMFTAPQENLLRSLFQSGKVIRLEAGNTWVQIGLEGSKAAVARLEECATKVKAALPPPADGNEISIIPSDANKTLALSTLSSAEKGITLFNLSCENHESPGECMSDQFRLSLGCDYVEYGGVDDGAMAVMLQNAGTIFRAEDNVLTGAIKMRIGGRSIEGGLTSISAEMNAYAGTWYFKASPMPYDGFLRDTFGIISQLSRNLTSELLGNQVIIVNSDQNRRNLSTLAESCSP